MRRRNERTHAPFEALYARAQGNASESASLIFKFGLSVTQSMLDNTWSYYLQLPKNGEPCKCVVLDDASVCINSEVRPSVQKKLGLVRIQIGCLLPMNALCPFSLRTL